MEAAQSQEFDKLLTYAHGDSFSGFSFAYQPPGNEPPPVDLARVVMQFRNSLLDETLASVIQTISSDSALEITFDPDTWAVSVKKQMLALPKGTWYWGMTYEDVDGNIDTLAKGNITVGPKIVVPIP